MKQKWQYRLTTSGINRWPNQDTQIQKIQVYKNTRSGEITLARETKDNHLDKVKINSFCGNWMYLTPQSVYWGKLSAKTQRKQLLNEENLFR